MSDPTSQRWLAIARHQIAQGQNRGAVETLRKALTEDPESVEAHALMALILLGLKRLHAAGREAELALALDPQDTTALYASARVFLAQRKLRLAEEQAKTLLDLAPEWPPAHRTLAELYELTGRRSEALPMLLRALELDPEDPESLTALGEWHLERGDLDAAEERVRQALEVTPENASALVLMGRILLRRGQVEEARDHAIWALKAGAEESALYLLAQVKARQSFWLGLWWRWSTWMGTLGDGRALLVLLGAYVVYRIAAQFATDMGEQDVANLIQIVWLAVVAYTWVGPGWFYKTVEKELAEVELSEEF